MVVLLHLHVVRLKSEVHEVVEILMLTGQLDTSGDTGALEGMPLTGRPAPLVPGTTVAAVSGSCAVLAAVPAGCAV